MLAKTFAAGSPVTGLHFLHCIGSRKQRSTRQCRNLYQSDRVPLMNWPASPPEPSTVEQNVNHTMHVQLMRTYPALSTNTIVIANSEFNDREG